MSAQKVLKGLYLFIGIGSFITAAIGVIVVPFSFSVAMCLVALIFISADAFWRASSVR